MILLLRIIIMLIVSRFQIQSRIRGDINKIFPILFINHKTYAHHITFQQKRLCANRRYDTNYFLLIPNCKTVMKL